MDSLKEVGQQSNLATISSGGRAAPCAAGLGRPEIGLLQLVSPQLARRHRVLPWRRDEQGTLRIITDRSDVQLERLLSAVTGMPVCLQVLPLDDVERMIETYYGRLLRFPPPDSDEAGEGDWAPLAVNEIIVAGHRARASDVHLEREGEEVLVRFRIDGVLHDAGAFRARYLAAVLNRIRLLAGITLADPGAPQSGRISLRGSDREELDVRVSIMPASRGPKVVLRILDRSLIRDGLEKLGLAPRALRRFRTEIMGRPHGMVLVVGPSGSGKTTTLCNMLGEIDRVADNVVTLEDPVEYTLSRTTQVQIDGRRGLTFASGLRSLLRQDPDVIVVGEIRDGDAASAAVRAALTGHRVFASLHAADAVSAIFRLLDLGVPRHLLAEALSGALAQRLVRRLCPECCEEYTPGEGDKEWLHRSGATEIPGTLMRSTWGCAACAGTGHLGRTGVFEVLPVDEDLAALIASGAERRNVLEMALEKGFEPLLQSALRHVISGATSVDEVMRVIHV
ncbi:MAG: GspE/PulE family protein [Bacillota bacterium]